MKSICTLILCFWQGMYSVAQVCGPIDPTFGDAGKTIGLTVGLNSWVNRSKVFTQPDGKIIQVGDLHDNYGNTSAIVLLRYNANGTPDGTFGINGKTYSTSSFVYNYMSDAVLQTDGKIVVAGSMNDQGVSEFNLLRFKSNGNLDSAFGTNGQVITYLGAGYHSPQSIAVQPDGKIIVAGTSSGMVDLCQVQSYFFPRAIVVRYNSNGSIDNSFGDNGKIVIANGNFNDRGNAVAIQADGKILTATTSSYDCNCEPGYYGGLEWYCRNSFWALQRFNPDGSPDTAFGENGKVADSLLLNQPFNIIVQKNGKIVVTSGDQKGFIVERYNNDGTHDNSFGVSGRFFTSLAHDGDYLVLNSSTIQPDGKIVLAGGLNNNVSANMLIVRYNADGSLDNEFFTNGIALFHVGPPNSYDVATGVALQDSKIITGGHINDGQSNSMVILRLQDPTLLPLGPIITRGGPVVFCAGKNVTLSANVLGTFQWYRNGSAIGGATGNVYTAASSGIYSLLVNNSGVCGISDTVVVTVNENPNPDIYQSGDVTICDGESVMLSTSNNGSLQWFNNGSPINGATAVNYTTSASGSYSVTAFDAGGCSGSSYSVIVTVKSNAVPVITWTGDLNFCDGGNVVLSTTTPDHRQWYKNGSPVSGATGATLTATSSGSYTESNGCKTSDPVVVAVRANSSYTTHYLEWH